MSFILECNKSKVSLSYPKVYLSFLIKKSNSQSDTDLHKWPIPNQGHLPSTRPNFEALPGKFTSPKSPPPSKFLQTQSEVDKWGVKCFIVLHTQTQIHLLRGTRAKIDNKTIKQLSG